MNSINHARRTLLEAARTILGDDGGLHLGEVSVVVKSPSRAYREREAFAGRQAVKAPERHEHVGPPRLRGLTSDEQAILDSLRDGPKSLREVVDATGIEQAKLSTLASNLKEAGVLKPTVRHYELADGPAPAADHRDDCHGGLLTFSEDETAILDAVRKFPTITLERLVEVTGLERSKCSTLHRNLKARNA